MKIGIITIPDFNNYGNRLQNYALQYVLEDMHCSVVSYVPYKPNIIKKTIKILLSEKKNLIVKIQDILRLSNFMKFDRKFVHTKQIGNTEYPKSLNNECDIFIAGSDQIWNPIWYTKYSLLQFSYDEKKIAYAASFGCDDLPQEKLSVYEEYLPKFKAIGVREETGKSIVKKIANQAATIVLDPTMLLTREQWRIVEYRVKLPCNEKKYILTYFLGGVNEEYESVIKQSSIRYNLEVINLNDRKQNKIYECGPSEFVYLIDNAALVLTDSFHACVFSIIFHCPFLAFDRLGKGKSMGNRIDTLLNITNMTLNKYGLKEIDEILDVDFSKVDQIIKNQMQSSFDFLIMAMKDR